MKTLTRRQIEAIEAHAARRLRSRRRAIRWTTGRVSVVLFFGFCLGALIAILAARSCEHEAPVHATPIQFHTRELNFTPAPQPELRIIRC